MNFKLDFKKCVVIMVFAISSVGSQALIWTVPSEIEFIRTYDGVQFSIELSSATCPNSSTYFLLNNQSLDIKSMISLLMMAHASRTTVRLSYNPNLNGTNCYIDGIWVQKP